MANNEALTKRSIGILVNLSAGLDETGRECDDDRVQLTANLRLAAAAGAAALSQRSKRSTPFANGTNSSNVKLVKSTANWLDQLKQAKGFHGDVTAAEFLGVSPTQFSRWRTGKDLLDNYHAWQIANALNVSPMAIIGSVNFHHARDSERTRWLHMLSTVVDAELPPMSDAVETPPAPQPVAVEPRAQEATAQGSKWTEAEDQRLASEYLKGVDIASLSNAHKRSIKAILLRLSQTHRLLTGEKLTSLCELYGVELAHHGRGKKPTRKPARAAGRSQPSAPSVFL
ncbi:helix-turn-helix domain-containing protein [Pseudomonas cichorii]|nr:helix-turn-helix transcriptional regulator [Pseudomonas cichorii]MBX8557062.1 helix-turn-helix domain-containing protein [Pseudomonas cichorii]MBX8591963.1 helix-turn-helix domain-containing protein [Pseudomonas cichorii]